MVPSLREQGKFLWEGTLDSLPGPQLAVSEKGRTDVWGFWRRTRCLAVSDLQQGSGKATATTPSHSCECHQATTGQADAPQLAQLAPSEHSWPAARTTEGNYMQAGLIPTEPGSCSPARGPLCLHPKTPENECITITNQGDLEACPPPPSPRLCTARG